MRGVINKDINVISKIIFGVLEILNLNIMIKATIAKIIGNDAGLEINIKNIANRRVK